MQTEEREARRLSIARDTAMLAGRCAPRRPIGDRMFAYRIVACLIIGSVGLIALWDFHRRADDQAVCESALHAQDWDRLQQVATNWLERSPRNGDAWMYLAQAAEKKGDLAWAATAFARVPDSHPLVVPALHRHLALTTGRLNRPLEAADSLERLLVADSRNPNVHRQAITFYAQTFQHARLLEQVRSSIALECEPPEAYIYLAAADGIRVSAPAGLHRKWVAAHPDCPLFGVAKTLSQMCEAHSKQSMERSGDANSESVSDIEACLDAAVARFPDNVELLALRIERSIVRNDQSQVGRLLDQASARTREDDRFWRYAAWRYATLGDPKEAEAACHRSQELNPLSWKTKRLLATLLQDAGRDGEAEPLRRLADEGQAIDSLVGRIDDPTSAPPTLLRRFAGYATASGDNLVARGVDRHLASLEDR